MVLRIRRRGIQRTRFSCTALVCFLIPTQIGYQDLAALLARQPAVAARWQRHIIASPFGTIHAATFSFPRPIGTAMPEPLGYGMGAFDPRELDVTGSLGGSSSSRGSEVMPLEFPTVDRRLKGDRLAALPPPDSAPNSEADAAPVEPSESEDELSAELQAALRFTPFPEYDISMSLELDPQIPATEPAGAIEAAPAPGEPPSVPEEDSPSSQTARLYFGINPMGSELTPMEQWAPGEEPILISPHPPADLDIKLSVQTPTAAKKDIDAKADAKGGETIAGKGEVTGEGKRPRTPAERLGLEGKSRDKSEKCLANAVYFESRGEPVRGQIAVAQVVMNRVFSGFYPNNVCGVVYQNAHRHLACQFTFACDGIRDVVTEPDAWERAKRIAKDTLDGKLWVPEVAKSTHYHAYWVRPSWVREMKKMYKVGVHTFYRPRAWGDGADAPTWGNAQATAEATAKL